tara:strand:- start:43 stop:1335 length:1293 start_codon:yes stop_codon:yes gene_type:complete
MSTFNLGSTGTLAINTILAEEANRIGSDIYSRTLHTSPWLDLTKQSAFPDGMGYQQTTLVYDRAVATKTVGGAIGANWDAVGGTFSGQSAAANTGDLTNVNETTEDVQGGRGTGEVLNSSGAVTTVGSDNRSFVQFNKKLKPYSLQRAVIESPKISLEDLRFAAHRQDQLRAIMDIMTQVTRNTWENRYRDEFHAIADNKVLCAATGTAITGAQESIAKVPTSAVTANVSNAILDKIYYSLIRQGAGSNAYGRENGRPVFSLVLSSEASYQLQTEAGFRDDVRYNNAKVSDLIAPLGIEKSFRGFYHLVDDLAPRYAANYSLVEPYSVSAAGVATPNASYESAPFEAAYVLHPEVCEALIPNPMSGSNGISFDPVNYRGKFDWKNIANEITNPDGTIGFFRGVLASATKPIKTEFGYVVLFKRDSSTPAA